MMLRPTAVLTDLREIASPRRGWPRSLRRASTVRYLPPSLQAFAKTRLNSSGFNNRRLRVKRPDPFRSGVLPAVSCNVRRSGRQAGTALGAASLDYLATTNSAHAGAKTVGTGTFDTAGLKGSFHDSDVQFRYTTKHPGFRGGKSRPQYCFKPYSVNSLCCI